MARTKKTSKVIESANTRLASLKSIDSKLDLGNGITVEIYSQLIDDASKALEEYNTSLSIADEKSNVFDTSEVKLKDMHERVLLGVGAKYGKNSNEYEQAGGTKKQDRKKIVKTKEKKPETV
jgi:hypothetical protein